MDIKIDVERLKEVEARGLASGSHRNAAEGMCAMEAVAYVAGLPFSDHPACVSPVIGAFMRSWNDSLPAEERTKLLLPLIPKTLNTVGSKALEERRSMMAIDWYIREHVPAFLRLTGLTKQAETLSGLSELTAQKQMDGILAPLEAIRDDASAAWSAARSAAESAARSAAWSAARSAARSAAWSAARSAARSAAESAARSAAWSALAETRTTLQQSAVRLIERMCEATENV